MPDETHTSQSNPRATNALSQPRNEQPGHRIHPEKSKQADSPSTSTSASAPAPAQTQPPLPSQLTSLSSTFLLLNPLSLRKANSLSRSQQKRRPKHIRMPSTSNSCLQQHVFVDRLTSPLCNIMSSTPHSIENDEISALLRSV